IASVTAGAMLGLFFEMLTMYFVLRRWDAVVTTAQDLLPLRPDYTLKLLAEFRRVGRTALLRHRVHRSRARSASDDRLLDRRTPPPPVLRRAHDAGLPGSRARVDARGGPRQHRARPARPRVDGHLPRALGRPGAERDP